jgi:hypothetical protein
MLERPSQEKDMNQLFSESRRWGSDGGRIAEKGMKQWKMGFEVASFM